MRCNSARESGASAKRGMNPAFTTRPLQHEDASQCLPRLSSNPQRLAYAGRCGLCQRWTRQGSMRSDASRFHCRVLATAMNALVSLASTTPASGLTPAIFSSDLAPASTPIALR